MSFHADKQTISDLNLTGKFKQDSIFNVFNKVHTKGGEQLLEQMFKEPLIDHLQINERSALFAYFLKKQLAFPFDSKAFDEAINYLDAQVSANAVIAGAGHLFKFIQAKVIKDEQYQLLKAGFEAAASMLIACRKFFARLDLQDCPFAPQIEKVNRTFAHATWAELEREMTGSNISPLNFGKYDHLLRSGMKVQITEVISIIYELDVCLAVASVTNANNFSFAKALPAKDNLLRVNGLTHPTLKKAVGNDVLLERTRNVIFLTGANMAGKSTLMKSLGIAVYLAHMGFPVSAKVMDFSVKEGLFSSINTPDDLKLGYSHFYAEVMRVKTVAREVAAGRNLLVIFDELFKGTNVKDAYDATLSVSEAYAQYGNCFFVISTHIIEVGEKLKTTCDNVQFKYLPTVVENNIPRYTYRLNDGITNDRQGMMIIENEGILDLLQTAGQGSASLSRTE
jgi:DNA mismatch repair ATPase MutS